MPHTRSAPSARGGGAGMPLAYSYASTTPLFVELKASRQEMGGDYAYRENSRWHPCARKAVWLCNHAKHITPRAENILCLLQYITWCRPSERDSVWGGRCTLRLSRRLTRLGRWYAFCLAACSPITLLNLLATYTIPSHLPSSILSFSYPVRSPRISSRFLAPPAGAFSIFSLGGGKATKTCAKAAHGATTMARRLLFSS